MVERDGDDTRTELQQDLLSLNTLAQRFNPQVLWNTPKGDAGKTRLRSRAVVGSAPHVEITLNAPTVSRLHAELQLHNDGVWVRDLGSLNGTFIEGVRVERARLDEGMRLQIGSSVLSIHYDREAAEVELWPVDRFGPLLGRSQEMRELFAKISKAAESDATVLIQGETGTGKELVATAIHEASPRVDGPFVVLDCGAIHHSLLESELYGHLRGAFTGAESDRVGAVEAAHRGTLFLDEVGELPLSVQPKLLRLLEARTVSRLGETHQRSIDVRFVAATNRDLGTMVNEGSFREDLYFRLAVLHFVIPPLRQRNEDIPLLLESFIPQGIAPPGADLIAELTRRPWPGNVRELRNFVDRAVTLGAKLALNAGASGYGVMGTHEKLPRVPLDRPFKEVREQWLSHLEREYISGLLHSQKGNVSAVAQAAGLNRTYIHRLIRKHDL